MQLTGYSLGLVEASWMTIQLAFVSLLVGLVLAVLFAGGEMSRRIVIKWPTTAFVTIVRGLPEILVVLFIYFGSTQVLFMITGDFIEVSPFVTQTLNRELTINHFHQSLRD